MKVTRSATLLANASTGFSVPTLHGINVCWAYMLALSLPGTRRCDRVQRDVTARGQQASPLDDQRLVQLTLLEQQGRLR